MTTKHPHAEDFYKRETYDDGFSKGWGMHFKPVADYFFDAHTHYHEEYFPGGDIAEALESKLGDMARIDVKKVLVLFKAYGKGFDAELCDAAPFFDVDDIGKHKDFFASSENFFWAPYMRYREPDIDIVKKSAEYGASAIKLHNFHLIVNAIDPEEVWLSDEWDKVFRETEKQSLPVLWHVTQRRTECKYRRAGAESYWKFGEQKGINYSNEKLLDVFLKVVERYPGINFVGAHQLHIGWERLGELLDKYPNLYTDTAASCSLRPEDDFYEEDREYLRNFFIKYADRIMFGTDANARRHPGTDDKVISDTLEHERFINKLYLPEEELQKVAYKNAERIYKA